MRVVMRRLSVKFRLLIGLILLLLAGNGIRQTYVRWNDPPYRGLRWQHDQENRVFEAVFRYQIQENRNNHQICFLSVRQAAPNHSLMQSFQYLPFVLPLSPRFQTAGGDYKDRTTGQAALHFRIDRIEWDSDTEVRVQGGGGASVRSGDAGQFTALWKRGMWQVIYEPKVRY